MNYRHWQGAPFPAVRFYEAEGLLQAPLRAANYRQYGQQHVDRLAFIVRCRSLDMSHDDIRALLQLQDDPAMSCDEVNALLDDQMRLVEQRIAELQALRSNCVPSAVPVREGYALAIAVHLNRCAAPLGQAGQPFAERSLK